MQMRWLSGAMAALIVTTSPAWAQAPAPAPAPSDATATDDPEQQIRCRRIAITGSHIRRERVGKTVSEWRRLGERGNEAARAVWERGRAPTNTIDPL